MKRLKVKYEDVYAKENLLAAFYEGIDKKATHPTVRELWKDAYIESFEESDHVENAKLFIDPKKRDTFLENLANDLKQGTYIHQYPRHKRMFCTSKSKGMKGKWRDIYCPSLRDHVMHHALMRVCVPAFMRGMYRWCVGSVPERGTKDVINAVTNWCRNDKNWRYFVILDIEKFFDNIRKKDVLKMLSSKIKDKRVINLHNMTMSSGPKATLVGYYPSPWYANLLLEPLDHFIMEKLYKKRKDKRIPYVMHYIRFVDDMLLLGSCKRDLEKAVAHIKQMISDLFGLKIKNTWEIKRIAEYGDDGKLKKGTYRINYVGYLFDRTRTIMRDGNFLSTRRLSGKMKRSYTVGDCKSLVSKTGYSVHTDNNRFMRIINDNFPISKAKEVISFASKCGI